MIKFENGIFVRESLFDRETLEAIRQAFFHAQKKCSDLQHKHGVHSQMENTVHHILFFEKIFQDVVTFSDFLEPVESFFSNSKFVLNSIGGNNNVGQKNYANNIHRDVRFWSNEPLMLNTIINVSGYTKFNGPTEFMPGSQHQNSPPSLEDFEIKKKYFECPPGSVIYFDSRIWHRAGVPKKSVDERIILTPIFSRPFIKQGFSYSRTLEKLGSENFSDTLKQLSGYYSETPLNHDEWYGYNIRRFYQKDQDT